MTRKKWMIFGLTALLLHGCGSLDPRENVIFVTKTSIGLDVDGTPPQAAIAYKRTEGFLGPRYDNGEVPPVASYLATDGGIFNRKVSQFYSTGRAAMIVSGSRDQAVSTGELKGAKKAMFFGTGTTTGVNISFGATGVDGFVFGYRRKELSYIPVGSSDGIDKYASVIGVLSSDTAAAKVDDSKFAIGQYFATGVAAENIARWEEIQQSFRSKGEDAFAQYGKAVESQNKEVILAYRCFAMVTDADFPGVLKNANELGLFQDDKAYALIKKEPDIKKARAAYIDEIGISAGKVSDRAARMMGHRVHVCGLLTKAG